MKIKVGFFAIMLALSLVISRSLLAPAALLAASLHELGHILMAALCKIRLKTCKIGLYGAGISPDGNCLYSYGKELLLCLGGPLVNLLSFALLTRSPSEQGSFLYFFLFSSLLLGSLNLLPIQGFDGGRILAALLSFRFSPMAIHRILQLCSFFCVFLLWSISVYLLLRFSSSLSLFIFSISLFCRIFIPES